MVTFQNHIYFVLPELFSLPGAIIVIVSKFVLRFLAFTGIVFGASYTFT